MLITLAHTHTHTHTHTHNYAEAVESSGDEDDREGPEVDDDEL
jgi:hypothetical protein